MVVKLSMEGILDAIVLLDVFVHADLLGRLNFLIFGPILAGFVPFLRSNFGQCIPYACQSSRHPRISLIAQVLQGV